MKKVLFLMLAVFFSGMVFGQMVNPVSWTFEAKKKSGHNYEIIATAIVEHPWHIYSQNTGKGGPVPTSFVFKPNPLISLVGKVKEIGKLEKVFDKNFDTNVLFYSEKVLFVQTVTLIGNAKTNISGNVEYMVCDDSKCLPPVAKNFNLTLQ